MELENIKQIWTEVSEKLDRNWRLNLELIRNTNLDKAKNKLRGLIWVKGITLGFYVVTAILFLSFAIVNWQVPHIAGSGMILALWAGAICVASIHELELLNNLNYEDPINVMQKKLSKIKLTFIRYLRLGVWIIPLYFVFIILLIKVLWGVDIVAVGDRTWILSNVVISVVVFLPFAVWAHFKLSPENVHTKWMNRLLQGNGSQISDAIQLLDDIERFETEQN